MPDANVTQTMEFESVQYGNYAPQNNYLEKAYINSDGTWLLTGKFGRATYFWGDDNNVHSDMLVAHRYVVFPLPDGTPEHAWIYKVKGAKFFFMFSTRHLNNGRFDFYRLYYSTDDQFYTRWLTDNGTQRYDLSPGTLADFGGSGVNLPKPPDTEPDPGLPGPSSSQKDSIKRTLEKFLKDHLAFGNEKTASIDEFAYEDGKLKFTVNFRSKHVTRLQVDNDFVSFDTGQEVTVYSVTYSASGAFDPYDMTSISNTEICVSLPGALRAAVGRDRVCRNLGQIASLIAGAVG